MPGGEVRLVDVGPVQGSEANQRRPAVVVSNDRANAVTERLGRGMVTVVPVTSGTARVFPSQVLLAAHDTGLHVDSKAQAEQVRAVPVNRLDRRWVGCRSRRWTLWTTRCGCTRPSEARGDERRRRGAPAPVQDGVRAGPVT